MAESILSQKSDLYIFRSSLHCLSGLYWQVSSIQNFRSFMYLAILTSNNVQGYENENQCDNSHNQNRQKKTMIKKPMRIEFCITYYPRDTTFSFLIHTYSAEDHTLFSTATWCLDKTAKLKLNFLISLPKHYVVGTQKNHLNEMVLLNTQDTCFNLMEKKIFTIKVMLKTYNLDNVEIFYLFLLVQTLMLWCS